MQTATAGTRRRQPRIWLRGLTLWPATALNMVDMIGVGPFTTLPLMVAAMHGPQAIYGWIAGAVLALSDGLIWAELGAAMPRAGGSYEYLKEIYGPRSFGRLLSFLFVFQLIFSAPVSIATGCIGLAGYAAYVAPALGKLFWRADLTFPLLGAVTLPIEISGATLLAMLAAAFATFLVYRRIAAVGRISKYLWAGVLAHHGIRHLPRALPLPSRHRISARMANSARLRLQRSLCRRAAHRPLRLLGLLQHLLPRRRGRRAAQDHSPLHAALHRRRRRPLHRHEPQRPRRHARPRRSPPWPTAPRGNFVAARAAELVYGRWAGTLVALLVVWTAFASVFSLLAGYSRIPFAAARDGNFFAIFQRIASARSLPHHQRPAARRPGLPLLRLSAARPGLLPWSSSASSCSFSCRPWEPCFWRITNPDQPRPFRMWLYPLPVLITVAGFSLVLVDKHALVGRGLLFAGLGVAAFLLLSLRRRQWPFARQTPPNYSSGASHAFSTCLPSELCLIFGSTNYKNVILNLFLLAIAGRTIHDFRLHFASPGECCCNEMEMGAVLLASCSQPSICPGNHSAVRNCR